MFPIIKLEKGVRLPTKGTYYVIAGNGIFLHKETGLIKALVKVESISFLRSLASSASLNLPLINSEIIARSLLFFRSVHRQHNSEAVVLLHYNPESNLFKLVCPMQSVSAAHADYDSSERIDGYQLVGSIHAHNCFNAFHSDVDQYDEKNFDGIHITIGRLDQPHFNISCEIVVNNNRFTISPEDAIMGIEKVDWVPWSFRKRKKNTIPESQKSEAIKSSVKATNATVHPSQKFYKIKLPDGKNLRHVGFPHNWLDMVTKQIPNQQRSRDRNKDK